MLSSCCACVGGMSAAVIMLCVGGMSATVIML